jgi:hypothetical protein
VQWKHTLYTFALRDSAHGECFVQSPTFTANDNASEYLDSFLVAFHDTGMNAHAIPNRKLRYFASVLFFLNGIDDLIHEKFPFLARSGGRTVSSRMGKIATAHRVI